MSPVPGAYQLGNLSGAMTGKTTVTANVSEAQAEAGETLKDHQLEYIQIGSYIERGSSFTVSATNQTMENAVFESLESYDSYQANLPFYTSADGEALSWILTVCPSLYAEQSGGYSQGCRILLANYLWYQIIESPSMLTGDDIPASDLISDLKSVTWNGTPTSTTGTFDLPNPGVYLIVDTTDSGNASLPIILSTEPSEGFSVPSSMTNYVTNTIALKTPNLQLPTVTQFVTDPTENSSGDLTGGTLTGSMSATIGAQNVVTYQVSNFFVPPQSGWGNDPNPMDDYYFFSLYLPSGMTFNTAGGRNMYVAGIPLSTLVADGDAIVDIQTYANNAATLYGDGWGTTPIADLPDIVGGNNWLMEVIFSGTAMQYILAHGYQTSNVDGKSINFSRFQGDGAGELLGFTCQAYLNSSVAYRADYKGMGPGATGTGASLYASIFTYGVAQEDILCYDSNGATLTTSGSYNGGNTDQSGKTEGTTQTNPDHITGTKDNGTTDGVPNNTAVGAGLNWMKIWGSGQVAQGASFYVQNSKDEYLYATGSGWGWTTNKEDAQKFAASTAAEGTNVNPASDGGLFEINGLADGTYTVTEAHAATGADQSVLPSFTITLKSGEPEEIGTSAASLNLVNNTPNGNPFNSADYNTVENVKSLTGQIPTGSGQIPTGSGQIPTGSGQIPTGLPLTGGAGILTGVIAAVILFGTAGIVLVVYRRRKQQED